jgi:hypothetical protein
MTNSLNSVVEFLAAFFLGITALLVLMVRLEASLSTGKVAERPRAQVATPVEPPSTIVLGGDA